jgi:LacI family sucrose operon transcriptional repressor
MNIIEIAKLAGVSKSTVSRYLNDGYVSEESRMKIQEVIKNTGYTPLRHAKTLRTKKTNLIGVIVPKISTETASRVIEGISDEISKCGYDLLIANTNLNINKEIEYLNILKNQVDGIIFMATKVTDKHISIMDDIEIPIVVVSQNIEKYPSVYYDDYNASKDVMKQLLANGYKKIAFIGVYEEDFAVGHERKRGYIDALEENKINLNEKYVKIGDFSMESGYKLCKELMKTNDKPDAIFAATDNIAIGAMEYLLEAGYKIPEDIGIWSIGDTKISRFITPKLNTVHYYYKTSGKNSGEIIMKLIEDNVKSSKKVNKKIKLGYRLISRNSV